MAITADAVRIKNNDVAFLTCPAGEQFMGGATTGNVSAAQVRGYIASIKGYLWNRHDAASNALRARLDAVETDLQLKHWLSLYAIDGTAWNEVAVTSPAVPSQQLRLLDHIALDLKEAAGHAYLCTPLTQNVVKTLNKPNQALRTDLAAVIALFNENSQNAAAAPIQTVAGPLNGSQRIDREQLTNGTHWTYRLQADTLIVGGTYGGILMQVDIDFDIAALRTAFTTSMNSVPLRAPGQVATAQGFYVQVDAPAWLAAIVAA
jgi:hypothetical protein